MHKLASTIVRRDPRPNASIRLFCLPSAGCGPSMFHRWPDGLPREIETLGICLPGRESLFALEPLSDLREIADLVFSAIQPFLDRPFALFGHSMGAWVAFELARRIRDSAGIVPMRLIVSALRAPHLPSRHVPISHLEDGALLDEMQSRYGGLSDEVLAHPELLSMLVPVLRKDIRAVESYQFGPARPLDCPIDCLGGSEDRHVNEAELAAWSEHSSGVCTIRVFPGGHFYLQEAEESRVLELIADLLVRNGDSATSLGRDV